MSRLTRVAIVAAIVFAGVVLPGSAAQACDCASGPPKLSADRADAVFLGDIVDRVPLIPEQQPGFSWHEQATRIYTIQVEQVFKGEVHAEQSLLAGGHAGSCGLELPASGSVLVYGTAEKADGGDSPASYAAWLCSGTQMTDSVPAVLGEGDPPISSTSGYESQLTITPDAEDDTDALPIVVGGVAVVLLAGLGALGVVWWRRRPGEGTP